MIKTVEFQGLKLTLASTKDKIALEKALGCSPLNHILPMMSGANAEGEMDFSKMQIPSLPFMIQVLHSSAQKLNAGVTMDKMMDLVDVYLEGEDASVFGLFAIVMEVLQTGKYLPSED
ncbi:MAG: hypothetical protein [Malazfec virus 1]